MSVYTRPDSPFYWLWLEGAGPAGCGRKERTKIRVDAPTPSQRRDNRELAEIAYHRRMTELARGRVAPQPTKPVISFRKYADWYETHVTVHKRGRVREEEILAQLRTAFDRLHVHEITRDAVLEWKTRRLAKVSPGTWNRELDVLKHMIAQAVPRYLEASPLLGMKRQRTPKRELRILTPEEEARLLKVLRPDDRAIVIVALDTLMRLSDILNLKRRDDHRTYLTVLDPKTAETYEVPVSGRLRTALNALPKNGDYYFARRRRSQVPRDTIRQVLDLACQAADIPYGRGRGITFHALRHTGASRMVERGADLRTVQEIGGWKSLRQLTRYTHPTDAAKRRAVELVSHSTVPSDDGPRERPRRRRSAPRRAGRRSAARATRARRRRRAG